MSNFTDKETSAIVTDYTIAAESGADYVARQDVLEKLANEFDKTVPQIRGVLVAAKVYIAKAKTSNASKDGTKDEYANAFRAVSALDLPSMGNMSKNDLIALWEWHVNSFDVALAEVG